MTGASWTTLTGYMLLFLGERILGSGGLARWVFTGAGLALVAVGFLLRVQALREAAGTSRAAQRTALLLQATAAAGLLAYGLTAAPVVEALGFGDQGELRWEVALGALWPVLAAAGLVPLVLVDRAILASPIAVHPLRTLQARDLGLSAVLAVAMLFPLNWLASQFNHKWDLTYFRTTEPGTAVRALVDNLDEPVRAVLFFPAASDVAEEVRPYFQALAGERFTVEVADHALDPALAEEFKVRENGHVLLVSGGANEKIKIGTDLDKAKKTLRNLDSEVQETLLKLAKGERVAYVTVGHGEYSWRSQDGKGRQVTVLKKLLEALNFNVKPLGIGEGLASDVPDDASMVFILGPDSPFLPEELAALDRYRERGGSLFVALDLPSGDGQPVDLAPVLAPLGLRFVPERLVTDDRKAYLPMSGGLLDRQNLGTNRYSSHESVTTLSRNRTVAWMVVSGAGRLEEATGHTGKVTTTLRTPSEVWADLDGDFDFDASETRKVHDLAAVASGPAQDGKEYRAVVVADTDLVGDFLLANLKANQVFVADAANWLLHEEGLSGEVNKEEDVKIVHSKEGQGLWFYGTTFAVPLGIGLLGFFRVRGRRRASKGDA